MYPMYLRRATKASSTHSVDGRLVLLGCLYAYGIIIILWAHPYSDPPFSQVL